MSSTTITISDNKRNYAIAGAAGAAAGAGVGYLTRYAPVSTDLILDKFSKVTNYKNGLSQFVWERNSAVSDALNSAHMANLGDRGVNKFIAKITMAAVNGKEKKRWVLSDKMMSLCNKLEKTFFSKEPNISAGQTLKELTNEFNENTGKSLYEGAKKVTGKINNRMLGWIIGLAAAGAAIGGAVIYFINKHKNSNIPNDNQVAPQQTFTDAEENKAVFGEFKNFLNP